MKIKKILLALGVAAVATMAFVACSSGEEVEQDAPKTEVSETAEPINSIDGVYRIEYDQADEEGWKTFLEVTVQEGKIVSGNFDEVNENNELNVADDEVDDALEQALLMATTPEEFEQMIEGQPDAETFKTFIEQLMPQIEQGNTETIVVNK